MKKYLLSLLISLFIVLAIAPSAVLAQNPEPGNSITGDQVIIGNTFRLEANDTLEGNILVVGGTVSTVQGSTVNGDLVLIGGTMAINGTINGDIVSIGGVVTLEDSAVVNGGLAILGTSLVRSPSAQITGNIMEETPGYQNLDFLKKYGISIPFTQKQSPFSKVINATFNSLVMAALAVVLGLLMPSNIKNVAAALVSQPAITGGAGLLTIVVAPIIMVLLAITIILLPVSLLAMLALALSLLFGFIVVGYEIGNRLSGLFKDTWHPSIAAGIGTLFLSLVTSLAGVIPCVGWILGFVASIMGLGAVIISRFGSNKFAPSVVQAVISPVTETPSQDSPENPTL